jgi:hypothetical protein
MRGEDGPAIELVDERLLSDMREWGKATVKVKSIMQADYLIIFSFCIVDIVGNIVILHFLRAMPRNRCAYC